jgi:hypothetical protein
MEMANGTSLLHIRLIPQAQTPFYLDAPILGVPMERFYLFCSCTFEIRPRCSDRTSLLGSRRRMGILGQTF